MIRFIYWLLALIEVALILAALLLFIVTDSRMIKYIAKTSLDSSALSYESIEGNLFDGLAIKKLSYKNKPLFASALIRWNPLTLFYDKVTITKLDAKGIEIENIIAMIGSMESNDTQERGDLAFSLDLNSIYFDINPYVYEGIKFSSFVFETGKIKVKRDLSVNADRLYLKFNSDIVNVKMNAKIKESYLLVDNLELKNISIEDITKLINRLKKKVKVSENKKDVSKKGSKNFLKDIKIKHIVGTLKAVQYGDLKIKAATLHLYNGLIEPSNNFMYQVEKLDFKGKTNFGRLAYKGYVKDANIDAKGTINLDKKLFKKYALPLNFKGLKKLPSTLRLNHKGVWIDIEHKVEKLLKIKSDFNLDIATAKHKLHYDYGKVLFTVDSEVEGKMTYAKQFLLKNHLHLDAKEFSYEGDIKISKTEGLPKVISQYLLSEVEGSYKGSSSSFKMDLDSELLTGHLNMPNYKGLALSLKSKKQNIALAKLIVDLPSEFKNEKIAVQSKSYFDFKNFKKSKIELLIQAKTLDVDAKMNLEKPFEIHFLSTIKSDERLNQLVPKLNVHELNNLEGTVRLEGSHYIINIRGKALNLFINYNEQNNRLEETILNVDKQEFRIQSDSNKNLILQTKISNIQAVFESVKRFYDLEVPNIQGEIDLRLEYQSNGIFNLSLKSPKLQYLSENSVDLSITNVYNIDIGLEIDKNLNIKIQNYQFNLDDNGYLNSFYSNKISYLKLNDKILQIKNFWLNDEIKITGDYDVERLIGNLKIDANGYGLSTKDFALILDLDLKMALNKERINIEGNIDILGDTITYEVEGTDIVEDADIIIVKDVLREKESAFNNLKLYLKIRSKKPLKYIADKINIEFYNELSLLKNYNQEILLTGVTRISTGYYQFEEKHFLLDESHLYFTGDIKTPLLDIKANYEKDEYTVHIFISGTTDTPIVNFNSEPFLTQQEILSLILFDGTGSSSGNGAEAYTLLGGTFAKGLIKSLGIDVDHLLLGRDAQQELSLEIGKRISKDISVLYLRKNGLDGVKVRVEHSNNFETDIIIQPPNTSSIEFLYKQDR